jgi:hypothetical protein
MQATQVQETEFDRALARLDAGIKRFETAVDEFCEAKKEFIANLGYQEIVLLPEIKGWDYV